MGFVVDYLNEGSFEGREEQEILHLEALCDMMEALTGDKSFTEMAQKFTEKQKGEKIMMCEYVKQLEARGEARGIKIGETRGEARGEYKLSALLEKLYDLNRHEDAERVVRDPDTRAKLYKEFGIASL